MTVNDVFNWIDRFAPFETQDDYDNAGLVVGDPNKEIHTVLFALDATPSVVADAVHIGAELIVTHHPLMFAPTKTLRFDHGEGAVLKALAANSISLIAAHTNLDQCDGGIADSLVEALGLVNVVKNDNCVYIRTGTLPKPMGRKRIPADCQSKFAHCCRTAVWKCKCHHSKCCSRSGRRRLGIWLCRG